MTGDSRSDGLLGRKRALGVTLSFSLALALGGCAVSFEDEDGRRQVVGLFSLQSEAPTGAEAATGEVRHFAFYGVWLDDTLRGTSIAVGEVELSIADLRNRWADASAESLQPRSADDCSATGLGFRWCALAPAAAGRAGELFDIAVAGLSIGVGARDRHFGVGYHRQTLLEVTNDNALVAWPTLPRALVGEPAQASVQGLLRGSFNG